MKTSLLPALILLHLFCALPLSLAEGRPATVKEYEQVFTTYPYSDPDPIPTMSRFYPYFRYDGFTDRSEQKKWKVVELSNDYLRVLILPEVGGKIWAAIEKSTGQSFLYFNHVVKFRDVSMRGPWTSGGIEPNYGIMGHTPNCFSPVDYLVRRNADGSASCFIGVLDLLTRSWWRLEINLPAGQACFSTRSLWHNGSGLAEPYYTWMNVGIKAGGNLQFVNPGTKYLGHDGRVSDWPTNSDNGHDLSWYDQNNFGSYKSYHVFGAPSEFFGGYWHDDDFGMARCSAYGDKPGRKIWIWGLSREGMIWEKLLTDTDGQYVEVQSGRLFNQADDSSTLTPFKHKEFPPYATDTWTEYWEPVKGTKGFVTASPWGAMNVSRQGNRLLIRISPTRRLRDQLQVFDGPRVVWQEQLTAEPMKLVEKVVNLPGEVQAPKVCFGGNKLCYPSPSSESSTRPVQAPADFDWNSTYGLYVKAKESARERAYVKAAQEYRACLKTDPNFAPALVELASLANRHGDYQEALDDSRHALSIDTYDPAANYQFGIASAALGHKADATDGFSIAALSPGWRSAATTELAKQYLRDKQYERALSSAEESLRYNTLNLDALELQAVLSRLQGRPENARNVRARILELDPLNHLARFENCRQKPSAKSEFTGGIRNELPHETYLELAAWYHNVGLDEDAFKVLELAPATAEVLYWQAYLHRDPSLLARAEAASPAFVFPFRREAIPVFQWADQQRAGWQPRYYLALIYWYNGNLSKARDLLASCGDAPRFAPFYAARAQVAEGSSRQDLETAARLDPQQWRFGAMLARNDLKAGDPAAALKVASEYANRFPENGVLAVLRPKTLIAAKQYPAAVQQLDSLSLLPCEGSTEAHSLFREAHLELAAESFEAGQFEQALAHAQSAKHWPERLGSGKPYPDDVDERLEDWLEYRGLLKSARAAEANSALQRVLSSHANSRRKDIGEVVRALALARSNKSAEARQVLEDWTRTEPASELPKWGLELLAGNASAIPAGVQGIEARALQASLK